MTASIAKGFEYVINKTIFITVRTHSYFKLFSEAADWDSKIEDAKQNLGESEVFSIFSF